MAGESTTLKVTIIGDSRSAQRAVSGLSGKTDSLKDKFSGFGGVLARGFGGVALVAAGAGLAAGKMGLEVAAGNEQAKIAFTTMLGSAQKADKFLREMQKFAAETPFEFPELQTAASSLISAGVQADKVIPIMRTLGDVTSGMGTGSEGVKRATVALQQMNAAGRITGEDLNQLRDAGIPVYDLLAKATGKSKAEVVKLAQAGKLGSKELGQMMKALETGKGLERFSGLMEQQSKSLTGMWSTFKDTLGQGLAKAIEPLIPLIKDGLGKASEFLAGVLPKVSQGLQNVVKWVAAFIGEYKAGTGAGGQFRKVVQTVGTALTKLWGVISVVVGWMLKNKAVTLTFIGIIGTVIALVKIWRGVQLVLNAVLAANPVGIIVVTLAALAAGLVYAYQNSETFRKVVDTAFKAIGAIARWLWNVVMAPVFRYLINAFATVCDWIGNMLDALSNIPGFGWAKSAADKMHGAARSAESLAKKIKDIPDNTNVKVTTTFAYRGYDAVKSVAAGVSNIGASVVRGHASGGRNISPGWSWVGEEGPELMWIPGGSNIYSNPESQKMMGAGGASAAGIPGGGGVAVYVTVQGQVMSDKDLAQTLTPAIRNELVKIGKRNGGSIFPK